MCDPLTIATMAAGAAGQVIKGSEANANNRRMIEARNKVTNDELGRQGVFQDQAGGIFDTSLGAFSPQTQSERLVAGQDNARTFFDANAPTLADVGTIGTPTANPFTAGAETRKVADVFSDNAIRSDALGGLTGWDQLGFDNRLGLAESGRELGTVSNLSANSARVAGLEQEIAPMNAYKPSSGLGDLLSFVGSYGAYNGGGSLPISSMFGNRAGAPLDIRPQVAR